MLGLLLGSKARWLRPAIHTGGRVVRVVYIHVVAPPVAALAGEAAVGCAAAPDLEGVGPVAGGAGLRLHAWAPERLQHTAGQPLACPLVFGRIQEELLVPYSR